MATTLAPAHPKLMHCSPEGQQTAKDVQEHAVDSLSAAGLSYSSHASTLCCQRQDVSGECSSPYRLPQPALPVMVKTPEDKAKHHSLMDILAAVEMVEQWKCSPVHAATLLNTQERRQQQQQEQQQHQQQGPHRSAAMSASMLPASTTVVSDSPAGIHSSNKRAAKVATPVLVEARSPVEEDWAEVRAPFEVYVPRAKRTKRSSSGSTQTEERRMRSTAGSAACGGPAVRRSASLDLPNGSELIGVLSNRGSTDGSQGAALPPLPPRQSCKGRNPAGTPAGADMQSLAATRPSPSFGVSPDAQLSVLATPVTIGTIVPDSEAPQGASSKAPRAAAKRAGHRWRTATALTGELHSTHSMHSDWSGGRQGTAAASGRSQLLGQQLPNLQVRKAELPPGPCEQVYSQERLQAWLEGRERMSAIETGELLNATRALTAKLEQMQRDMHAQLNSLMWEANRADVRLPMPDILLTLCHPPSLLHAPSSSLFGGLTLLPRNSMGPSMVPGPLPAASLHGPQPVQSMQPVSGLSKGPPALPAQQQQQTPTTGAVQQQQQQQQVSPMNTNQMSVSLSCPTHTPPMRLSTAGAVPGAGTLPPGMLLPGMPPCGLAGAEIGNTFNAAMPSCSLPVLPPPAGLQHTVPAGPAWSSAAGMNSLNTCGAPASNSLPHASSQAPTLSLQGAGGVSMSPLLLGLMPPLPHLPSLLHPAPHASASTTTLRLQPLPTQPMWRPQGLPSNQQQQQHSYSTSPDSSAENRQTRPATGVKVRMPATLSLDNMDALCCSTLPTPPGLLLATPPQQGIRASSMHGGPQQTGLSQGLSMPSGILPPIPSLRVSPSPMDLFAPHGSVLTAPFPASASHAFNAAAGLPLAGAAAMGPNLAGDSVCVLKVQAAGAGKLMETSEPAAAAPGLMLCSSLVHK